jgi:hypothetical protein
MHEKTSREIIAEGLNGYVSRCTCCQEFNVCYKNVLLVFDEDAMMRFFEWILENRTSRTNYQPLPHGRNRVYASPHSNLYLAYNDAEIDELEDLSVEVRLVLEARKLVGCKRFSNEN